MPSLIRLCAQDRHICEEDGSYEGSCSVEFTLAASEQVARLGRRNRIHSGRDSWIEGTGKISPAPPTLEDRRECHVTMTHVTLVSDVPLAALRRAAAKRLKAQDERVKAQALQKAKTHSARPINASRWVTNADYPPKALKEHVEGAVRFRVTVNKTGNVRECSVVSSSGSIALDNTTCGLVSNRARFEPAKIDGVAIEGNWSGAVRWVTPRVTSK